MVDAVLQVHKAASVDILLGTDARPRLGFALIQVGQQVLEDRLSCSPLYLQTPRSRIPAQEAAALPNRKPTSSDLVLPTQTTSQGALRSASVQLIQATNLQEDTLDSSKPMCRTTSLQGQPSCFSLTKKS